MKNNKYKLVEAKHIKDEGAVVPSVKELQKLKEDDFVFLVFEEDKGDQERMWVKISKIKEDNNYEGVLANEPTIIKSIKQGEKLMFKRQHIANFSTKEEQERILNEFKKTGKLPFKKEKAAFEEIREIIRNLIELPGKYENGFKPLYKIKKIDRVFFLSNLEDIADDHKSAKSRNTVVADILTQDLYKMFLSLVLIIVIPQIAKNLEDEELSYDTSAKEYYAALGELINKSGVVFEKIAKEHIDLLAEVRRFYMNDDLNKLKESELPLIFKAFIDEVADQLSLLS